MATQLQITKTGFRDLEHNFTNEEELTFIQNLEMDIPVASFILCVNSVLKKRRNMRLNGVVWGASQSLISAANYSFNQYSRDGFTAHLGWKENLTVVLHLRHE